MTRLEDLAEKKSLSKLQLMENAGLGLYKEIRDTSVFKKILIVCGSGNNGGDGFVLARHLHKKGYKVNVLHLGKNLKKESGYNYFLLKDKYPDIFTEDPDFSKYDIVIDAMLGTGVKGKIREPYSSVIDKINNSKYIISVDIPTGVNPDTGGILDKAVKPDIVYTFHDTKPGLKKYKVKIVDIGINF